MEYTIQHGTILDQMQKKGEIEEIVRTCMTELKRTGELHRFEDDVERGISHSSKYGKLNVLQTGTVTELQKKKKKTEVKNELEKRMGNFHELEKRTAQIVESTWMRLMVSDAVHANVRDLLKKIREQEEEERAKAVVKKEKGEGEVGRVVIKREKEELEGVESVQKKIKVEKE